MVAFTTYANNLGPTDSNGDQDVYVRDLGAGTTTLVSVNAQGTDSGTGRSVDSRWTADGAAILFESDASNLGPADDNGLIDVYIRYLGSGETGSISSRGNGTARLIEHKLGRNRIFPADRVLFRTLATDLGPADDNGKWDVCVASPEEPG